MGLGVVLVLVLVGSASALGYMNYKFTQLTSYDVGIDVPPAEGEARNYLLVGSDSRAGLDEDDPANGQFFGDGISASDAQRTDTIMILRIDPDDETAQLLSLPRDLYVPIADTGDKNRINVAFTRGREVLIETIRENFGIPIHHYIEINLVGFLGLVDAIGGVPYYFDTPVRDTHSGLSVLESGCVTLDPRQSLAFARSRYLEFQDPDTGRWRTDGSGDFGRISRQQAFIRAAIGRAVSKGLSNPITLNDLVTVGVESVGRDPSLEMSDILGLGKRFAGFDEDTLLTYSLPATPFRTSGGASVLDLNVREAEPILNLFRGLDDGELTPGLIGVTVLNGTDETGFAGDISVALETIGFHTEEPGDAEAPTHRSVIRYAPGHENVAAQLARYITVAVDFEVDDSLSGSDVILIAGSDFTTVHEQPSPTTPEIPTTTTSVAPGGTATVPGDTATTTTASTTTTTEPVGFVPGADRDETVDCG